MASKIAFVLGNGTSRKDINHHNLKRYGTVYGCNALFREFAPDHVVCVDTKMVTEINDAQYQHKHNVWSNRNKLTERTPGIKIIDPNKGWSSGPTALMIASQHGHKVIYIMGFDYVGIGEQQEKVNNIYAGTRNYKKTTDKATYYGNWLRQTTNVIKENKNIQYFRVIQPDNFCPPELNTFENFKTISYLDLVKILKF